MDTESVLNEPITKDKTPSLWIGSLAAYNQGYLVGDWFQVTQYTDEGEYWENVRWTIAQRKPAALNGMSDEELLDEIDTFDTEYLPEGISVHSHFDLIKQFDYLDEHGRAIAEALVTEGIKSLADLNDLWIEDILHDYYRGCFDSERDYSDELAEAMYCDELRESPSIAAYFDYEAFHRDIFIHGEYYSRPCKSCNALMIFGG